MYLIVFHKMKHIKNCIKGIPFIFTQMALTQSESAQWLSVVVRLSRKAYYPGAVVSGVITIEPATESDEGEYISFISAQVGCFLFASLRSSMAILGSFQTLQPSPRS